MLFSLILCSTLPLNIYINVKACSTNFGGGNTVLSTKINLSKSFLKMLFINVVKKQKEENDAFYGRLYLYERNNYKTLFYIKHLTSKKGFILNVFSAVFILFCLEILFLNDYTAAFCISFSNFFCKIGFSLLPFICDDMFSVLSLKKICIF